MSQYISFSEYIFVSPPFGRGHNVKPHAALKIAAAYAFPAGSASNCAADVLSASRALLSAAPKKRMVTIKRSHISIKNTDASEPYTPEER